jgi:hypothetical protein
VEIQGITYSLYKESKLFVVFRLKAHKEDEAQDCRQFDCQFSFYNCTAGTGGARQKAAWEGIHECLTKKACGSEMPCLWETRRV